MTPVVDGAWVYMQKLSMIFPNKSSDLSFSTHRHDDHYIHQCIAADELRAFLIGSIEWGRGHAKNHRLLWETHGHTRQRHTVMENPLQVYHQLRSLALSECRFPAKSQPQLFALEEEPGNGTLQHLSGLLTRDLSNDDTMTSCGVVGDEQCTVTSFGSGGTTACPLCDKKISRADHLKRHIAQTHASDKTHACHECDASFARRYEGRSIRDKPDSDA